MGALRKFQNSIQTLVIFWPVYPIHTNSLFWVTFEKLSFCHFLPPNTSIRGKDSQISVDHSFELLSFSSKRKTTILFPSPLTFLQWPILDFIEWLGSRCEEVPFEPNYKCGNKEKLNQRYFKGKLSFISSWQRHSNDFRQQSVVETGYEHEFCLFDTRPLCRYVVHGIRLLKLCCHALS